jgi:hypothetical protein
LGEDPNDGAIDHFVDCAGAAGSPGSEYLVILDL